jgi:UDP-3-O-acyl N-acetylglucosamine deacetylase
LNQLQHQLRGTLAAPVSLTGRGVHSGINGTVTIRPAPQSSGIRFVRTDLPGRPSISARLENLDDDALLRRTTLAANGGRVRTIEHLMSAMAGLGVHDAEVEMDCEEMPFLDGSALPFAEAIQAVGVERAGTRLEPLKITTPLHFTMEGAEISALPSADFRISFFFTSDHPNLRAQAWTGTISPDSYLSEIAPARTFCFFEEIEMMRRAKLIRGANLSSAVVIGRKGILNNSLRFQDEPVRHKILDFIGDTALLGAPLQGHFLVWRAGHKVNAGFARFLQKEMNL